MVKYIDLAPLDLGTLRLFRDANEYIVCRLFHMVLLDPFKGWCVLDLSRAPCVLYGVKYIDLVSL